MNWVMGVPPLLRQDLLLFLVFYGVAALDVVLGAGKALLLHQFSSSAFRQGGVRIMQESALPVLFLILGAANPTFRPFIQVTLWYYIGTEAISVIEHLRGKIPLPVGINRLLHALTEQKKDESNGGH